MHLPTEGPVWISKDMLRRLRLRSRDVIEAEVRPVPAASLVQLVLQLQQVGGTGSDSPMDDLAECLAIFEGSSFTASVWEEVILPARVPNYHPSLLDGLLDAEEVIWSVTTSDAKTPTVALYPSDSLFAPQVIDPSIQDEEAAAPVPHDAPEPTTHPLEKELLALLGSEGPLTMVAMMRLLQEQSADEAVSPQAVAATLHSLAHRGRITSTSFDPVRNSAPAAAPKPQRRVTSRRFRARATAAARSALRTNLVTGQQELESLSGRWRLLLPPDVSQTEQAIMQVESILDTYGVICPKTIDASGYKGGMQAVYAVLRGMEDAGEVIRGEFVEDLGASQFTRRHTVERLRSPHATGALTVLAGTDPAMLYGSVLPWPEAPEAVPSNRTGCLVVLKDGAPLLFVTKHLQHLITFTAPEADQEEAVAALVQHLKNPPIALKSASAKERLIVQKVNGRDVYGTKMQDILSAQGFIRDTHGMRLYLQPF